jgi:hypothetical protein
MARTRAAAPDAAKTSAPSAGTAAKAKAPAASPPQPTAGGSPRAMTPAAALKRHIEWLEYALGAARSEETWRAGRLEKASKANRDKRAGRLAEVRDEVAELSALLQGIHDLETKAKGPRARAATTRTRARARAKPATGRRTRGAATPPASAG